MTKRITNTTNSSHLLWFTMHKPLVDLSTLCYTAILGRSQTDRDKVTHGTTERSHLPSAAEMEVQLMLKISWTKSSYFYFALLGFLCLTNVRKILSLTRSGWWCCSVLECLSSMQDTMGLINNTKKMKKKNNSNQKPSKICGFIVQVRVMKLSG